MSVIIQDIPDDLKLTNKQQWQLEAYFKGEPLVDEAGIESFIADLTYPIYYFDYETFSLVIPPVDGVHSYQQVPFQYSLHRLDEDGTLQHFEYIHREATNPIEPLTRSLMSHIGDSGSVLVWYESFEKGRNKEMGAALPHAQQFYEDLNDRIVDLMIPFSKGLYVDAQFGGSASIKKVLPVVVPELSYKELAIQEGNTAQRTWMQTVFDGENEAQKQQIFDDLIKYCTLDTFAMVEILRFLQKI